MRAPRSAPRAPEPRGPAGDPKPRPAPCRFMNHRAPANTRYKPTCYEHAANCYTHAFLIVPAIVGSALLHRLSDDRWEKITAWIYGMGLCALFIVSTVFHIVTWKKSHLRTMEQCFHMCDRMVIYFFIAASYAPCHWASSVCHRDISEPTSPEAAGFASRLPVDPEATRPGWFPEAGLTLSERSDGSGPSFSKRCCLAVRPEGIDAPLGVPASPLGRDEN
ncbi:monocyte to macrophage differentiation factor isoform X2 [Ornithorhynchus anatinus]|uniref:monocyte to macrophage differentiation factor isoform X2 n=1 Tax=Ornithorhynchus anatinus TaxID=9258 RepID=UPI0010A8C522|nr:monocyte to macrophage differentiation factor isoform X2 [Ornithorhynchus anatinus]